MLGLGWTEMLVIGVMALIFIGPKDLPVVMKQVGKVFGQIRRMGNDFQREINRSTGLDEVRNLRNSITAPLKKTSDEIRREFNAMTPTGPKPSGKIKPADPKAESVVDEIKAAAGITPPKTADQVAAESGFKAPATTPKAPVKAAATKKPAAKKAPVKKAPVKAKAAPTRPVVSTDLPPLDAPPAKVPAKQAPAKKTSAKPAAAKQEKPATKPRKAAAKPAKAAEAPAEDQAKPAPRKRASAKPKTAPDTAAKAGDL